MEKSDPLIKSQESGYDAIADELTFFVGEDDEDLDYSDAIELLSEPISEYRVNILVMKGILVTLLIPFELYVIGQYWDEVDFKDTIGFKIFGFIVTVLISLPGIFQSVLTINSIVLRGRRNDASIDTIKKRLVNRYTKDCSCTTCCRMSMLLLSYVLCFPIALPCTLLLFRNEKDCTCTNVLALVVGVISCVHSFLIIPLGVVAIFSAESSMHVFEYVGTIAAWITIDEATVSGIVSFEENIETALRTYYKFSSDGKVLHPPKDTDYEVKEPLKQTKMPAAS